MNLRDPLLEAIERMRRELLLGNYDDPHVAFTVFVYPDQPPAIKVLSPAGVYDITEIKTKSKRQDPPEDQDGINERFFTRTEFSEAHNAMRSADLGLICGRSWADEPLGQFIKRQIEDMWKKMRELPIRMALESADMEKKYPEKCPYCNGRFTTRGIPMHWKKNRYCGRKHIEATNTKLLLEESEDD